MTLLFLYLFQISQLFFSSILWCGHDSIIYLSWRVSDPALWLFFFIWDPLVFSTSLHPLEAQESQGNVRPGRVIISTQQTIYKKMEKQYWVCVSLNLYLSWCYTMAQFIKRLWVRALLANSWDNFLSGYFASPITNEQKQAGVSSSHIWSKSVPWWMFYSQMIGTQLST